MRPCITWYDLLGALPDASSEDILQAYDAKAGLLRPEPPRSFASSKPAFTATRSPALSP